jgi:hypothetical protein
MQTARVMGTIGVMCMLMLAARPAFADEAPVDASSPTGPEAEPLSPPTVPAAVAATEPAHVDVASPQSDKYRVQLAPRFTYVGDPAFDSFASNDVLPQLSIEATRDVKRWGKLSLGVGLGWDVGGRTGTLRHASSHLTLHRFIVPVEARYAVNRNLLAFGRIAPGAAVSFSGVDDSSSKETLKASAWAFAGDMSLGASVLLGLRRDARAQPVRFWLSPEIGYTWTTKAKLDLRPDQSSEDALGRSEPLRLGALSIRGLFWKLAFTASF